MPEHFDVTVDGKMVGAIDGETVAGVLMRRSMASGTQRPTYVCGMGSCFACVVELDGRRVRACMTPAAAGMCVNSGAGAER